MCGLHRPEHDAFVINHCGAHQLIERNWPEVGGSTRAFEHQQVVDQPRKAVGVVAQVGEHLRAGAVSDRVVDIAAQAGDRRAKLV